MRKVLDRQNEILLRVRQGHRRQIAWRRHLHQFPELSFEEHKTTAYLSKEIRKLKLKVLPAKITTGLLAELEGNQPGATVAIRSDIDALPVPEQTNLKFKSRHPGCMHACGHDMHMATVLGAAQLVR